MSHLMRTLAIGVLLLLAALIPRTALADPLFTNHFTFSYTDTTSCSFPLQVQGDGSNTLFADGNGAYKFSFHGGGTVSAFGTTFTFVFDGKNTFLTNGYFITNGLQEHVTVPGYGLVIVDVGRIVYDPNGNLVSLAGQHDFSVSAYPALCPYFG